MSKWIEHTALKRNTHGQKIYKNIQYPYTTGKEKLKSLWDSILPQNGYHQKKTNDRKTGKDVGGEKKMLHIVNGNVNLRIHHGNKNTDVPQKRLKLELSYNPAVTSLNIYPKESK